MMVTVWAVATVAVLSGVVVPAKLVLFGVGLAAVIVAVVSRLVDAARTYQAGQLRGSQSVARCAGLVRLARDFSRCLEPPPPRLS
jgi:ABC-type enterobactin transport system permease subunit